MTSRKSDGNVPRTTSSSLETTVLGVKELTSGSWENQLRNKTRDCTRTRDHPDPKTPPEDGTSPWEGRKDPESQLVSSFCFRQNILSNLRTLLVRKIYYIKGDIIVSLKPSSTTTEPCSHPGSQETGTKLTLNRKGTERTTTEQTPRHPNPPFSR